MKYSDAIFVLLVCALAFAGLAGFVTVGEEACGAQVLRAQAADFDALAYRVFGGNGCNDADAELKRCRTFQ